MDAACENMENNNQTQDGNALLNRRAGKPEQCEEDHSLDKKQQKPRQVGPDIVRTIAAVFVVAVHFYLNCGYYSTPLHGPILFLMTVGRWLFLICVPLFMILTGYFKSEKTLNRAHYRSLIPVLVSYVVISVVKVFASNYVYGKVYTFEIALKNIANYQIAWYVGMYLSLMALIPFLNRLWKALISKKEKQLLIGSLAFVSTLYPVFLYLVPSYWQMLYPFVYYYLGVYFKEYRPKVKKLWLVLITFVIVFAEAITSFAFADGKSFIWNVLGPVDSGYSTITVVVCAASVFLLLYDVEVKTGWIRKVFQKISEVSLEIYLFTGVYDAIVFYYLKKIVWETEDFFWWFFATVPTSFLLAWISSMLLKLAFKIIREYALEPAYQVLKERKKSGSKG